MISFCAQAPIADITHLRASHDVNHPTLDRHISITKGREDNRKQKRTIRNEKEGRRMFRDEREGRRTIRNEKKGRRMFRDERKGRRTIRNEKRRKSRDIDKK